MSPGTFGHNGAGGQIAWADPATGLSFAFVTNGYDRHEVRQPAPHDVARQPGRRHRAGTLSRRGGSRHAADREASTLAGRAR